MKDFNNANNLLFYMIICFLCLKVVSTEFLNGKVVEKFLDNFSLQLTASTDSGIICSRLSLCISCKPQQHFVSLMWMVVS